MYYMTQRQMIVLQMGLTHSVNLMFYYYITSWPTAVKPSDQNWHKIDAPASYLFTAQHAIGKEIFYLCLTTKEQLIPKK